MSHTETTLSGQIVQALAAVDPCAGHSMRAHGIGTLGQVFRFVPHEACMAALSTALAAGDAEILGEIVAAFERHSLDKAIDDLSHDPSAVEQICKAARRRDDPPPDYYCHYSGDTLMSSLAIKEHVESLAIVIRHSADWRSSIKESIRELALDSRYLRPNLQALSILLDVCANQPKIDPETQTDFLVDALVHCAGASAHDIIDTLAPTCTPYILYETLLRCSGDGASYRAFDNIWRIAEGTVCVHRMAKDLAGGNARVHMRRCIGDLGKGRPCKSIDCIYGSPSPSPSSCTSARPRSPSQDAPAH
ncbi:hypothetical protein psal_cds_1181 [Pandoravirus salinus]|uniref:Uncharacterized protein n=1 Tax=Pandoravirus salinus TaxID=1349410 RepID=S4W457_9VIRU|nr:hypothetical protein psal_cds_1181 [Pandoravirus salinus]AGO85462.1 hypothetical protein psal_cds_1181 [Pandoravirus salinus]